MVEALVKDYIKDWDAGRAVFTKKSSANELADLLANETNLTRRSVVVEGKKGEFHVLNMYIGMYWMPLSDQPVDWANELVDHKKATRRAMDA
jgi:hypothetical protein